MRLASSIIAHSSPRTSMPWPARRVGVDEVRLVAELVDARARWPAGAAGSMVTTATRAPSAARPIASAAEVVVLPTPPEPAQMTTRLPARRALTARAPASRARARAAASSRRRRRTAASRPGRARRRRRRRSCARCARARAWAWRAARTSGPSGAASSARDVGGAEALGQHAVADDEVDLERRRRRAARPAARASR